mgnify:CR=1 FL=1
MSTSCCFCGKYLPKDLKDITSGSREGEAALTDGRRNVVSQDAPHYRTDSKQERNRDCNLLTISTKEEEYGTDIGSGKAGKPNRISLYDQAHLKLSKKTYKIAKP